MLNENNICVPSYVSFITTNVNNNPEILCLWTQFKRGRSAGEKVLENKFVSMIKK